MYGTAEEYFYGIISSQPHVKYSQCFLMAVIKWFFVFCFFFFHLMFEQRGKWNFRNQVQTEEAYFQLIKGKVLASLP